MGWEWVFVLPKLISHLHSHTASPNYYPSIIILVDYRWEVSHAILGLSILTMRPSTTTSTTRLQFCLLLLQGSLTSCGPIDFLAIIA